MNALSVRNPLVAGLAVLLLAILAAAVFAIVPDQGASREVPPDRRRTGPH